MKKLVALPILIMALIINSPSPSSSAEIIGSVSVGDASCLAAKGKTVYCGLARSEGNINNLQIIDVTDHSNPVVADTRTVGNGGPVLDMAITPDKRFLVVVCSGSDPVRMWSLEKWCIDNPLTPTLTQRVNAVSKAGTYSVCVDDTGTTAFITSQSGSETQEDDRFNLRSISLKGNDGSEIETTSTFDRTGVQVSTDSGKAFDSQSAVHYVYTATENGIGKKNFQIRDIEKLKLIGGLDISTSESANNIAYCVATEASEGITAIGTNDLLGDDVLIIDTSDPVNPKKIGGIDLGARISLMRLDWPNLYCFGRKGWFFTEYDSSVKLVSLADRYNPTLIEEIDIGSNIKAVEVTKEAGISLAYVATAAEKITTQGAKTDSIIPSGNDGSLVILTSGLKAEVTSWELYY